MVPAGVFRVATAPLVVQDTIVGYLQLGAALDADYAAQLTSLSGAGTLILSRGGIIASTLPVGATRDLTPAVLTTLPEVDIVSLNGEQYAIRMLLRHGDLFVYTLDSIDASAAIILGDTHPRAAGDRAVLARGGLAGEPVAGAYGRPSDRHALQLADLAHRVAPVRCAGSAQRVEPRSRHADRHLQHTDGHALRRGGGNTQRVCRRDPRAGAGARRAGSVHGRPFRARQRHLGRGRAPSSV